MTNATSSPYAVRFLDVKKTYGSGDAAFTALTGATLDIADNEFFTLLGPSGSGKTTLLRLLAGFEAATAGEIHLFGHNIRALPPEKRPVNTVFQHYSLFPHMTVAENVAFGLHRLRWRPQDITDRVVRMLSLVHLKDLAARYPSQLSGGQQQRVALARALAPQPRVLLLDEPLSALDLKLRQAMRDELTRLQQATGITFVFVTHDQDEALSMSNRIAVLANGSIQQIGTPDEIYLRPSNRFVADFIGDTNFLEAVVVRSKGDKALMRIENSFEAPVNTPHLLEDNAAVTLCVRPENVLLTPPGTGRLEGRLVARTFLGSSSRFTVQLPGGKQIAVRQDNRMGTAHTLAAGEAIGIDFVDDAVAVLAS